MDCMTWVWYGRTGLYLHQLPNTILAVLMVASGRRLRECVRCTRHHFADDATVHIRQTNASGKVLPDKETEGQEMRPSLGRVLKSRQGLNP